MIRGSRHFVAEQDFVGSVTSGFIGAGHWRGCEGSGPLGVLASTHARTGTWICTGRGSWGARYTSEGFPFVLYPEPWSVPAHRGSRVSCVQVQRSWIRLADRHTGI